MASYKIQIQKTAEKELKSVPSAFLKQMVHKIYSLTSNPRPHGVQLLKGEERYFRIRQGDYRIVYEVNDAEHLITIIKIGHRREVYK